MDAASEKTSRESDQLERLFAHLSMRPTSRSLCELGSNSDPYLAVPMGHHWTNSSRTGTHGGRRDYDSCTSSSCESKGSPRAIGGPTMLGGNNEQLDVNNSSQGIDMLNLPSTAETLAKKKTWIEIYFRYRLKWHEVQHHLSEMSREDAYKPENLKLWTRYVKIFLHRKVPFINAVKVFCNRMQCPRVQVKYTLNSFYSKAKETEKRHILLPIQKCPDDIPEFKKMARASANVFVTSDEPFFDEFWKKALEKKPH